MEVVVVVKLYLYTVSIHLHALPSSCAIKNNRPFALMEPYLNNNTYTFLASHL